MKSELFSSVARSNRTRRARGNANLPRTRRARGEANLARLALLPVANQNQKFPSFQKNGGGCRGEPQKIDRKFYGFVFAASFLQKGLIFISRSVPIFRPSFSPSFALSEALPLHVLWYFESPLTLRKHLALAARFAHDACSVLLCIRSVASFRVLCRLYGKKGIVLRTSTTFLS